MKRIFCKKHIVITACLALLMAGVLFIAVKAHQTQNEINGYSEAIRQHAFAGSVITTNETAMASLPAPVRKYLAFVLPENYPDFKLATISFDGNFRRPLTTGFDPTHAMQLSAINSPAMLFVATDNIGYGLWAKAFDFYAKGEMRMSARILSAITVVDEKETTALNQTSLRRWLLESPLYPQALLPGGPVRWEHIDNTHARAIVSGFGLEASLIATFNEDGSLASFEAEEDGDLLTPYHGSGERVVRGDYRSVQGIMIPHAYEISRVAKGKTYPFWVGKVSTIIFE